MQRNVGRIDVFSDPAHIARALADLFSNCAQTALGDRGAFYVALAGGSTPRAAYELLAAQPLVDAISWSDVFVYFGDERCVFPDDPRSNYRMAQDAFLSTVPIPPKNVHRMPGELPPKDGAGQYAQAIRADLGDMPQFDLVMLGIGKDGHTASLFPGTDPTTDDAALVRATYSEETGTDRLSITPRVINNARTVVICAEGIEKAPAVAAAREGDYDPTKTPVQIVSPINGELIWLLDRLAAGMLKHK
ncbi:MAG TPA: 6-phosphogluconolactonase [Candidatus Baltobacteraceae bacterium]